MYRSGLSFFLGHENSLVLVNEEKSAGKYMDIAWTALVTSS